VLKKTITYEDFNGDTVTEDHFFHLSKAELVELEMSHKGGLSESLGRIIEAEDNAALIKEFKNLILTSYGKRSDDGKRFIKTQELRDEFISTEAYSTLFMELVTDTDSAIGFVNGVIPQDLSEEAAKVTNLEAVPAPEVRIITPEEIDKMSAEEVQEMGPKLQSGEWRLGKSELETS
jgi:hypothetical protein